MPQKCAHAEGRPSGRKAGGGIPKMELAQRPERLTVVGEDSLLDLHAGEVILLDESVSLRPMVEPDFFAVLSCPCCGILGLITYPQYMGIEPAVCGADECSCRFRILEQSRFEYLRAS